MPDWYDVLGLTPSATDADIQQAYARSRARLLAEAGPDSDASEPLRLLDEALAALGEPAQRAAYDRATGRAPAATAMVVQAETFVGLPQPAPLHAQQACPHCQALNPSQATVCLSCGQQISRACPQCGRPVLLSHPICGRCGTVIKEYDVRRYAESAVVEQRVQDERESAEARHQAAEAVHRVRAAQGVLLWIVVVAIIVGVMIASVLAFSYLAQRYS